MAAVGAVPGGGKRQRTGAVGHRERDDNGEHLVAPPEAVGGGGRKGRGGGVGSISQKKGHPRVIKPRCRQGSWASSPQSTLVAPP